MSDTILPALVIFAILLGIALYGLYISNAKAERKDGSRRGRINPLRRGTAPADEDAPPAGPGTRG